MDQCYKTRNRLSTHCSSAISQNSLGINGDIKNTLCNDMKKYLVRQLLDHNLLATCPLVKWHIEQLKWFESTNQIADLRAQHFGPHTPGSTYPCLMNFQDFFWKLIYVLSVDSGNLKKMYWRDCSMINGSTWLEAIVIFC